MRNTWCMMQGAIFLQGVVLCGLLAAITVIDLRQQIIPDALNLLLAACGLAFSYALTGRSLAILLVEALVIMGFFGGLAVLYRSFRGRAGLGWGDVKFMGAATFWVGWLGIPLVTLIGSISGLIFVLVRQTMTSGVSPQTRIPFGPHLSLGLLVVWFMNGFNGGA